MNFLETLRVFQGHMVTLPLGGDAVLVGILNEYAQGRFSVTAENKNVSQHVFNISEVAEINITHEVTIVLGWTK